ncbi:hypothetical protein [Wolbachia endosymbiont of Kerria lacca]
MRKLVCDIGVQLNLHGCQWALLHHSRKEQAVTDGICYKIDI